jgi:hypothetical protein
MTRSAWRKAIAAMRRDDRAELEHELGPVPQTEDTRIDLPADAVHVDANPTTEAQQPGRPELTPPHREQIAERHAGLEPDDAGRVGRPEAGSAAGARDPAERQLRTAQPDRCRDDHDPACCEQLEVHTRAAIDRRRDARPVRGGQRVVLRADADRRRHESKQRRNRTHRRHAIPLVALVALLAGCGSGNNAGSKQSGITVQPAREYRLDQLSVVHPRVGTPAVLSFRIVQPDGTPLTAYKRGAGPHTGVHLILVRRDLSTIIHRHPAIRPDGSFSESVTFPSAGPYRIVVDAYPAHAAQTNFQLFSSMDVAGKYRPEPLPVLQRTQTIDGYRFTLEGIPHLRAIEPAFLHFTVTRPDGSPPTFTPWFGALAHAIFFRKGSLDYFHTHVCAPGASACTSALGSTKVTGTSATPGKLTVGVLVPLAGVWRLFLQCRVDGQVITAPFTLVVT